MCEYKMIEKDEEYSSSELREKYNDAVEDIWYLEWRIKELDSDYEDMLYGFWNFWTNWQSTKLDMVNLLKSRQPIHKIPG